MTATATAEATTPLLELHGISKSFGSVQALSDVEFEVRTGEVMALVGDNGAGKSTLIKCVAGTHTPDSGDIVFDGNTVHIHGPKDAAKLGIEVVYQDLALCDNLDVVQNMRLRRGRRSLFGSVVMSSPSKRMLPATGSSSRSTVCAVVVFPQPDSPTSASSSPRPSENETPSTARTSCRGRRAIVPMNPRGTG